MAKQYDVLFKLLLLGDSGVGKTCLLCRFTDNEFHPSHISTIGKMKTIKTQIRFRFQTIDMCASGVSSQRNIANYWPGMHSTASLKVQKILVGNKSDEEQKRQVATEQGNKLAEAYGMDFFETSAFTNHNITESFTRLAELVLQANKKDLDLLGGSMNDEFNLAVLEEQEGLCNVSDDTRKSCWC
uniref:small monomeric GTPase n=1 Tax=Sinocyclocheilus grahami TaxID=75366 RepID=A0A672NV75_SINGR